MLVGARNECPLVVGLGEGENYIASAIPAFLADTRRIQLIEDGEIVVVTPDGVTLHRRRRRRQSSARSRRWTGTPRRPRSRATTPSCSRRSTSSRARWPRRWSTAWPTARAELGDIGISDDELRGLRRVVIVACGTSYHAGLIGRYAIETWSRVPVEMDVASEFRYRDPVIDERDLVIGITQSGETLDTLAAMRLAREKGAKVHGRDEHHGQPGHPRRRRGAVHPRRPGDRRGGHQDVRLPGGRHVPVRAEAGPGARHAGARSPRAPWSGTCTTSRTRSRRCWPRSTSRSSAWPSTGRTRASSCTWAATPAWGWRWRAR